MDKFLYFAITVLLPVSAFSAAFQENAEIINRANSVIIDGLKTPEFIQYYQKGKGVPSCSLARGKQVGDIIFLKKVIMMIILIAVKYPVRS